MQRRVVMKLAYLSAILFGLSGCSDAVRATATPCDRATPLAGCGMACGGQAQAACPMGLFCGGGGTCTANCGSGPNEACPMGYACSNDGQCISTSSNGDGGPGNDADANVCASAHVQGTAVVPTVMMLIDQSGSMNQSFGSGTRWSVLRDSLLAQPNGFLYSLQSSIRFGVTLYSATSHDGGGGVQVADSPCPKLTKVSAALDNYTAMNSVYSTAVTIDDTPTGDSINAVAADLMALPNPNNDPMIIILATDGAPDSCATPDPRQGTMEQATANAFTVSAVTSAFSNNIRTYVISIDSDTVAAHLQAVANAGVGMMSGNAPYWVAGDDQGLRDALNTIISGTLSCTVSLQGQIQNASQACLGTVKLNGATIPCNDPNGWHLVDSSHIELQGTACNTLKSTPNASIEAEFPCTVMVVF